MINLGLDYTSALNQSAGIGRYTRELVKALANLELPDWQLHLFAAEAPRSLKTLPPNARWHPTRLTERWLHRLWFRLRLPLPIETWTGPLDLFHAPDFFLPPLKRDTLSLVTVHDLSFIREPDSVMPGMTRHLNTWVPRSVQRARHVIAVSESTRNDLIELYQTPPQKISVVHHGVTSEFTPEPDQGKLAAIRRKYQLADHPFILSVGTVQPRKNYRRLIQAFARLDTTALLAIAGGPGWDMTIIHQEVERQGLQQRVQFLGYVADAELPLLYNAATLFAYPSLYEGFGLPALEALACGTPVIAADRSALPEVVGQAGLLVDPLDIEALAAAMSRLLHDEALRRHFAQAGLAQAARFNWANTAQTLIDLYRCLLV